MRFVVPALVSIVLAVPMDAQAAARWAAPVTLSRAPGPAAAAVDMDGNTVVAWTSRRGIYAARRTAHRSVRAHYTLRRAARDAGDPAVQFDADGDAVVAYRRRAAAGVRAEAVAIRPGGRLTPPALLRGTLGSPPAFAAAPTGTQPAQPVLAWRADARRVRLATASFGQLLGSIEDPLATGRQVRFALGADGVLLAITATPDGVFLAVRPPLGPFRAPTPIAPGPGPFTDADVAAGPNGTFAATWVQAGAAPRIWAAIFSAAGFGVPIPVSLPMERARAPRMVITAARQVRIAYVGDHALRLATLGAGVPITVSPSPGPPVSEYAVGADGRGGTLLAWRAGSAVLARAVRAGGDPSALRQLSGPRERARTLDLAVGPRGDAVAVWSTRRTLRMARRSAGD